MKIIKETKTPNGIDIQLEDWQDRGLQIGAYPIAKNTGKYGWIKRGETFRLTISSNKYMNYTDDNVKSDFEALESGAKTLEDLAKHFWNGKKDMFYLGMVSERD